MQRHPLGRAALYAVTYLGLLLPSFVTFALAWHWLVEDVLYHHWDRAPIGDFFPPFIDPLVPGDRFIVSAGIVYLVWYLFQAAVFLAPALAIWLAQSRRRRGRPAAASVAAAAQSLLPALLGVGMIWVGISLFWGYNAMRASGLGHIPGLMALLRGVGQALYLAWLALTALAAVRPHAERWALLARRRTGIGILLAVTVGGPLYFLLGAPGLAAALIVLLTRPRAREGMAWVVWLTLPAVLGTVLAPLPAMNRLRGPAEAGLALLTVGTALGLARRWGRRAGLPALALGFLLWQSGLEPTYTSLRVFVPDTVFIPFAILLLVASPLWLLRILPAPRQPHDPQPMQEAADA
jgi:hypothetical protein